MNTIWNNIVLDLRTRWLIKSLITTLGFSGYVRIRDNGYLKDLRRVLENAKKPRLIVHPELGKPLRKNMGWIGRWFGYRVIIEPYNFEGQISAMDYSILNDWKKSSPIQPPDAPHKTA